MTEGLTNIDLIKVILFVAPGAAFAIFRSFALRGFFPKLSKDDLGALVISSSVYSILIKAFGTDLTSTGIWERRPTYYWIIFLFIFPMIVGLGSGLVEANDYVGRFLRKIGLRFPSPEPNAWETMFREMPSGAILIVRLDDIWVYGRWVADSASSHLSESFDLFLAEIGSLSDAGIYEPYVPARGIYLSAGVIKRIEIVKVPIEEKDKQDGRQPRQ